MTTPPAAVDEQLAAAQTALDHATSRAADASEAMCAARGAYYRARQDDPASELTGHARHAWVEAEHDMVDAHAAIEEARDHLAAINRQARP